MAKRSTILFLSENKRNAIVSEARKLLAEVLSDPSNTGDVIEIKIDRRKEII